ncbi:uncharacterized protein LOC133822871 [Humulus lupulus]|uniref:uncharacterized protein LOC133822871 n=1 Tax=Humulus lupulus TaxID=3486 RepID=UPI002B4015FB|nr:uncharacterized protein LOC133822871 [Humulus lupulus]
MMASVMEHENQVDFQVDLIINKVPSLSRILYIRWLLKSLSRVLILSHCLNRELLNFPKDCANKKVSVKMHHWTNIVVVSAPRLNVFIFFLFVRKLRIPLFGLIILWTILFINLGIFVSFLVLIKCIINLGYYMTSH